MCTPIPTLVVYHASCSGMAPFEQLSTSACAELSFCFGNGLCRRDVRKELIFCECQPKFTGLDCSIPVDQATTAASREEFIPGVPLWLWILGLVLLFIASVFCVIYMVIKCKRYPNSSAVDLRANRGNERGAALDLLNPEDQHQNVRITVEVCD